MLEVAEAYLVNDTHTKINYTAGRRVQISLCKKNHGKKFHKYIHLQMAVENI